MDLLGLLFPCVVPFELKTTVLVIINNPFVIN